MGENWSKMKLSEELQAELNSMTDGILVKSHAKGEHKADFKKLVLCATGKTSRSKLQPKKLRDRGRNYTVIKVKYVPASHMTHEFLVIRNQNFLMVASAGTLRIFRNRSMSGNFDYAQRAKFY